MNEGTKMYEINLSGFVGDELTPSIVQAELDNAGGKDILVQFSSPGGFVFDGMEIYQTISRYAGKKTVILGGLVASIATYISTAFDVVKATESSVFMIHNAEDYAIGDYKQLKKVADRTEKANSHIAERLAARSGKTIDETILLMDSETWYYGQEIVDNGFADEIIKAKDSGTEQPKNKELAIAMAQNYFKDKMQLAAVAYKNNNDRGNSPKEKKLSTKDEIFKTLTTMKENGELSLMDIAKGIGLEKNVLTDEHREAVTLKNALKDIGVEDPVKEITDLRAKITANAETVKNAQLAELFGVSDKDADGNEKNLLLAYASDKLKPVPAAGVQDAIEALKIDPIAIKLRGDQADNTSNVLGFVDNSETAENIDSEETLKL